MSQKILVTYASRSGSTAEVAEAIGKTLGENGDPVDIMPMSEVTDLSSYKVIVAGSAIRKSKWLPEAVQFINSHRAELSKKTFAVFTVCITLAMSDSEHYHSTVKEWVAPVRALVHPVMEGYFAGMLDFSKLPLDWDTLLLRATVALGIFPRGDHRNWNAINAWSESLKSIIGI